MTCKEIPPNNELQVGYSYEYAQKYGLPVLLPMDAFIDQDNRIVKQDTSSMNIKQGGPPNLSPQLAVPMLQEESPEQNKEDHDHEPRNVVIETYSCFECDQEFNLVEDLQAHINTHKDTETIRKPKKKAMKKFQNAESDSARNVLPPISSSVNENFSPRKESSQTMNADSSTVMESSTIHKEISTGGSADVGKQQDNSVTTGVGQPAAPPKVKCSMCYKSFATKERLEKHMIVHSDEDTKPLKCGFCTKRFLTNSALAGHIKTHAGKKVQIKLLLFYSFYCIFFSIILFIVQFL